MPTRRTPDAPTATSAPDFRLIKRGSAVGAFFVILALCSVSLAQIDVPAESQPHKLIVAKLTTPIPTGAYLADGGWEVVGASATVVADVREYGPEIVWTGTPGAYQVLFDGVLLQDVTVPGMDGQPVIIKSYLGRVKARAACVIKGTPGPDPPDPPVPGGKYKLVLWHAENQLDNLPQGQRDILRSLVFRDWLRSQGHVLLEELDPTNFTTGSVPAQWQPWLISISGKTLPAVSLQPVGDGPIVGYPLPANTEAMKAFLTAPAGKAVKR